ncbi:VOC family protein [Pseudosulfitobacter sp. SM2401]|uniref:VOC family protein n=1 Tax=Pseudosulfitobacter sp. SM2401 TaxID=3350098 RepID=UPI0036F37F53
MTVEKIGRVIWHDLLTSDRQQAMSFYKRVAGWTYQTEHATDFAWGGGEKDFILALEGDEAGAGFAETPPEMTNGWVAYVEVLDVDGTVALTEKLGGTIVRQPFEVPGVGRNALLRDPLGARIGVSISRHSYPVPQRQFGLEVYLTNAAAFPQEFYSELFDWTVSSQPAAELAGLKVTGPSGEDVALVVSGKAPLEAQAVWVPSIKVADPIKSLNDAAALGGEGSTCRLRSQRNSSAPLCSILTAHSHAC